MAGWIFAALGSLAVVNMALVMTRGGVHVDIGGTTMLNAVTVLADGASAALGMLLHPRTIAAYQGSAAADQRP